MQETLQHILVALEQELVALYGDRLTRLVLFGSHARREATEDSDVDVMVVLRGEIEEPGREIDRMMPALEHIWATFNELVSVIPISEKQYQEERTPLLMNVRSEGIEP